MTIPAVSVVIATRERPAALHRLLRSVQVQDLSDFECIVVDDGSSADALAACEQFWPELDGRFQLHRKVRAGAWSGGPGMGRNAGVALARGPYVAFCDDDDYWTRTDHLSTAARAMAATDADLLFADMQTSVAGQVRNPSWFGPQRPALMRTPVPGQPGVYDAALKDVALFLLHRIFHANTLVVRKDLLDRTGGYWDKINFAEDHDFAFRLADQAKRMLFRDAVVADLDVSVHPSIARTFNPEEQLLFGVTACLHAESRVGNPLLRAVARANRAWKLCELSQLQLAEGRRQAAAAFAREAVLLRPTVHAIRSLARALRPGGKAHPTLPPSAKPLLHPV